MYGMITAIIIAIISLMGNVFQFLLNKKSSDSKYMNSQLEYIKGVLKTQGDAYAVEKQLHEKQMRELEEKVKEQDKMLKNNKEEIAKLQRMVNRLIGSGCHIDDCPQRSPYTVEEINEMTKNNKKNEKDISRNKK